MSAFMGKCRALTKDEEIHKGKLGNWIAVKMKYQNKTLVLITSCRLPMLLPNSLACSLTEHNLLDGKAKSTWDYRKETFQQIKTYLNNQEDVLDVIIAEDFNQNIASNKVH